MAMTGDWRARNIFAQRLAAATGHDLEAVCMDADGDLFIEEGDIEWPGWFLDLVFSRLRMDTGCLTLEADCTPEVEPERASSIESVVRALQRCADAY